MINCEEKRKKKKKTNKLGMNSWAFFIYLRLFAIELWSLPK